ALTCTRRDLLAGDGGRLADDAARGAAHQIDMDMIGVMRVGARRQHRVEHLAGAALDVTQKSLLCRQAAPAVLYGNAPPVGEREGGDIERITEGMFGNVRMRIAVHAAARV